MSEIRVVHGLAGAAPAAGPARPRLSRLAVGLGAAVALLSVAALAPQIGRVVAEDDGGVRAFHRSEARPRAYYPAPIWRSLPAQPEPRLAAPRAAPFVAYAPLPHLERNVLDRAPAGRAIDAALARETGRAIARAQAARLMAAPLATGSAPLGRRAVCVRLCDGFHFPLGAVRDGVDAKAQGAMCGQLCPGAPTRLFVLPEGSEKMDQAVSLDGRRYSALPVAFRHATTRDPTCGCRRPGRETQPIMSVLEDLTLRRGDTVMTGEGVRVFKGATRWPLRRNDFAAVGAISLPKEMRSKLVSLDRAARRPPPPRDLPAIAQSPVRPAVTRHLGPAMAGKQVRLVAPVPGFALVQ